MYYIRVLFYAAEKRGLDEQIRYFDIRLYVEINFRTLAVKKSNNRVLKHEDNLYSQQRESNTTQR